MYRRQPHFTGFARNKIRCLSLNPKLKLPFQAMFFTTPIDRSPSKHHFTNQAYSHTHYHCHEMLCPAEADALKAFPRSYTNALRTALGRPTSHMHR